MFAAVVVVSNFDPTLSSICCALAMTLDHLVQVKKYHLLPTPLVPNSPLPLLHYKQVISKEDDIKLKFFDLITANNWELQWLVRYGETQDAHYHSAVHECMAVLSGRATIRFGVADSEGSMSDPREGYTALELLAEPGDVFLLPAGVCHKTFDPIPNPGFMRLTPGDGHSIETPDVRQYIMDLELSGFTMMGCYPRGHDAWDFRVGGEHEGRYEQVWDVLVPEKDPILGDSQQGICELWKR